MVEPELMKNGGMQIMDMDAVLRHFVSEFIRSPHGDSVLYACPRHPDRERVRVVIAPEEP